MVCPMQPKLCMSLSGATSIAGMAPPGRSSPRLHSLSPQDFAGQDFQQHLASAAGLPAQPEPEPEAPASPGAEDCDGLDWDVGNGSEVDSEQEDRGSAPRSLRKGRKGCVKVRRSTGIAATMSLESLEAGGFFDMTMQAWPCLPAHLCVCVCVGKG